MSFSQSPEWMQTVIGPSFEAETVQRGRHTHLVVRGEIDIKTAPELDAALSKANGDPVVLDLSQVSFVDSTGLRVLVMNRTRLEADGGNLVVCAPEDSPVLRTMRLAGLVPDFRVIGHPDELTTTAE